MNTLGLVPGGGGRRERCLGQHLTAYADRAMDPALLRHWDRHLIACTCCRAAVEAERRVLASLRSASASSVPGELRGMLLALATAMDLEAPDEPGRPPVPPVPVAPVPVVDRGMPAFHRSARRATVFAGLAAGATAAAAWSLAITGGAVTPPTPAAPSGTVQRTPPAVSGYAPAVFTFSSVGLTQQLPMTPAAVVSAARPAVGGAQVHSAESTP